MNSLAHPALLVAIFAGVAGALALTPLEGAALEPTPFQAIPPVLATPPAAASVPYDAELIEGDPERKNRWRTDQIDRLEDFERVDLTRTGRFEGVDRLERFEPAAGAIRPDRVERPEPIERPAKIERPEKIERLEKIEKLEKVERRERLERPERNGRQERVERVDRSGRR